MVGKSLWGNTSFLHDKSHGAAMVGEAILQYSKCYINGKPITNIIANEENLGAFSLSGSGMGQECSLSIPI